VGIAYNLISCQIELACQEKKCPLDLVISLFTSAALLSSPLIVISAMAAVIDGTDSDNSLNGTMADDTITGKGANDNLYGNGGNDGNDYVQGGSGIDTING
jgi:hypothetical protein